MPIIFPLALLGIAGKRGPFRGGTAPLPAASVTIAGVSRDASGAALGGCTCTLLKVETLGGETVFTQLATAVSDGSGNYSFVVGFSGPYRVMFDLDGAPTRAGLTLKTLSGV